MPGRKLYRVWIDETGDRGHTSGSSPFFGFAAVAIAADKMSVLRAAKQQLNRDLGRPPTQEVHWSTNLKKNHDARMAAAEALAGLPVRILYSVVAKSSIPPGARIATNRDYIYNYPLRLLLERVSWLVDEVNGEADVNLAAVKGLPGSIPRNYISLLRSAPLGDNEVRWAAIRPTVQIHQAAARDGIQMADVAAGALDRAIRPSPNPPHRMEPAYLKVLLPLVYCRRRGGIGSYGLKALPPDLWKRFPWWTEALSLERNVPRR